MADGQRGQEIQARASSPGIGSARWSSSILHKELESAIITCHDLKPSRWICHPGGPKVIETIQSVLRLGHLAMTWNSLNRIGNLSSASVLHVLADTLAERPAEAGDWGVLTAMGPGFCAELLLLRW